LLDRETKQVEFVRADGVKASTIYVYDGAESGYRFYGGLNNDRGYGTQCNKKVRVMREFVNAETNQLGMALPKGKLRFYRRDADGQMEFVGEDMIDHTPRNETIRVTTGNAFDLVGERKQTNFRVDTGDKWLDETFEIKLRNRKQEPVEFRVVEHLYRWNNWEVTAKSDDFKKTTRRPSSSACRSSPMRSGRRLTRCIIRGDPGWSSCSGASAPCPVWSSAFRRFGAVTTPCRVNAGL